MIGSEVHILSLLELLDGLTDEQKSKLYLKYPRLEKRVLAAQVIRLAQQKAEGEGASLEDLLTERLSELDKDELAAIEEALDRKFD